MEPSVGVCVCTLRKMIPMLSVCFQAMSPKEKGKFEELAKRDKARYDAEMSHYIPPKGTVKGGRGKKKYKDPNAPKRPP